MYTKFSRDQFEIELSRIIRPDKFIDRTVQLRHEGNPTMERIYEVGTKHPKVIILIFSSIDIRTDATRPNGKDRVRLIMRWETKKGFRYRRLKHHNRVDTLFKNFEESIIKAKLEVFSCHLFRWTPVLEEVLK